MPFGLKNAGATYQRMMQKCLATQIGKNVQVYIDDVVITTKKGSTLIDDLRETFDNLDKFRLKLNPTKCSFGVYGRTSRVLVSARGIEANPEKIQAIVTMRKPTKLNEIQQSNVDPNNVPLASLVAQEENVDVNFIKNNNFNNNAYRNNSGNNYRPYPSANGNGYGNSYGNSYNNNRSVPSGLEAMLKEFISTQTAFNKSVEEKLDKIDTIASRVDRLASDVNLLKLKVMPNNDIDNKITTTANAIQVRINENIRLMAELRARWDREENEKLAKENNVAKVWTITTTSNANSSHVAAPPTINGNIIGVGNVSTPSAKRTKLPEIAKTAETACDKTAEIFSNLGNNDPIAVAHNDLDFDDCHISEVIKFLQKLAKSPNASAINLAFTKHITNALIKAREEKLKLETSIPRKLEDGWEPIIKMKFNDFECNALCDLGASISVMPKKIYDMLDLPPLKNCYLDVNLADNVKKKPLGRIDNVHITVNNNLVPVDFVVLDIECNASCPIVLGRPFLRTVGAVIDMREGSALAPESLVLRRITFRDHQPSTCFLAPPGSINLGFFRGKTCHCAHHTFLLGFPTDVYIYAHQDKTLLDTACSGSFTRNKEEFKWDLLDRIQENTEEWENDKGRESGYVEKPPFKPLPPKEGNEEKEKKKKGTKKRKKRGNKKKEVTAYPRVYEVTIGNRKYVAPNDYYDNESEYNDLPMPFTHISDHDLEEHTTFDIGNLFGTDYESNDDSTIHVPSNDDIESSKLGDVVLEDPIFETFTFSENDDITYSGLDNPAGGTFMSITLGAATKLLDDMMINYSEWHTERAPQGKKVNSVEETSSLSDKIDVIMSMLVNGRSNVDPNNVPLASLVAQEENVDVNFIKNNNFNNNAYRNNSGNNYRPYPSANGNGYGNSYGNSYNNNRSVPSGLEAMLKEFISTQTAFNKSVEEKLDKIDTIASRVDRLASDVNLLKLKVMPNNDIDNKITTTANAIQVRINENIRLMAELRARWDREENEKLAKENNVAKVWTITTTSNANSSHVAAPPTINGKIIGVGNVSTPSAKRTKLPEIAKTAETACDKTAEIFSNLGNNDPIAVAHNDLDFDDCHISEVIKFLQKLAKSPNASAINLAFTKHITNALIKAREEKLKLETSIPRKLEDGWEPIIKMKFNDFECNALCDLGASISVMPKKIYDMLDLPPLKNCYLDVNLADNVKKKPLGRIDNVRITVNNNLVPVDFVVLDIECNASCPIVLGRPFLRTVGAVIDMREEILVKKYSRNWTKLSPRVLFLHEASEDRRPNEVGPRGSRGWWRPKPGRADLSPGPLVWPLALTLRLLKASVAKPQTESHDTENLTDAAAANPISGDSEIASGTLPERGFISRRTLHRHGRLRSDE
ncbi:hypothetical protein QYE76_051221 [Lolium multiflorum]|uniref:Reverse transcriptase domain-containing protein n=1 Tax=Lolium multiflorum TaxID=4521 RepID=A0AAD8SSY9_LOLMU|nr:hypothetical protein QYE76_051221 [Lolium multiflorum]